MQKFKLCLWLCKNEGLCKMKSPWEHGWYFWSCSKFLRRVLYTHKQSNQWEGTPRVTVSSPAPTGKAPGERLGAAFGRLQESPGAWRGRVVASERLKGVAEYQFSDHFSRWAGRETGDLSTTRDKLAVLNSSAGTLAWVERSVPVGQLAERHFQSTAIYSSNGKLLNKCWSDALSFLFQAWNFSNVVSTEKILGAK